jgi:pyruvate carboxylase
MSIHRQKADEAFLIGHRGQYTPVGAYVYLPRLNYPIDNVARTR